MIINLPLSVPIGKKDSFSINLNTYRNAHFYQLNAAKIAFKEQIQSQIDTLPLLGRIEITYVLYPKTRRLCDVANICSIADKFFSDALTESGIIEDDNYMFLGKVEYLFGDIDKHNPRVEAHIKEIEMRITQSALLGQEDIAKAIGMYVRAELNLPVDAEVKVSFTPEGAVATVGELVPVAKTATATGATKPVEATPAAKTAQTAPIDPEDKVSLLNGPENAPAPIKEEVPGEQDLGGIFGKKPTTTTEAAATQTEKPATAPATQVGGATTQPAAKPAFSFGPKT